MISHVIPFPAIPRYSSGYYASESRRAKSCELITKTMHLRRGRIDAIDILSDIPSEEDESLAMHLASGRQRRASLSPSRILSFPPHKFRDYHPLGTYAIRSPVRTYPRFRSGVLPRET